MKSGGLNPVLNLCKDDDAIVRRLALISMLTVYTGTHAVQTTLAHPFTYLYNLGLSLGCCLQEMN